MEKLTKDQEIEYWKAKAEASWDSYMRLQVINQELLPDADRYVVIRHLSGATVYLDDQPYWGKLLDKKLDEMFQEMMQENFE